jgi:hypothetical protein
VSRAFCGRRQAPQAPPVSGSVGAPVVAFDAVPQDGGGEVRRLGLSEAATDTIHRAPRKENTASAELVLTGEEIARPDALPVSGARRIELGHNWSYGVTPRP